MPATSAACPRPPGVTRIPQRRLVADEVVEIDHQPEEDERDERIKPLESTLAHRTYQRSTERMRKQEMGGDEQDRRKEQPRLRCHDPSPVISRHASISGAARKAGIALRLRRWRSTR